MSKTLIICHLVFATKDRKPCINPDRKKDLYSFIYSILKKNNCWTYRINGMYEHLHVLFDLNPNVTLAGLVKEIKLDSNKWLKQNEHFPKFEGWAQGYFAVSVSPQEKENVMGYIINQEKHHAKGGFIDEVERLILQSGMKWYPDDWY